MKTLINMKSICLAAILPALLLTFFSSPAKAQEKKKEYPHKAKIIVKIDKGDNNKTMIIDTTFNLANPEDQKRFEEYIKKMEGNVDEISEKMKNMEITVNIPDLPDSLLSDTLEKQIICIGKGGKIPRVCMRNCMKGFDFKFDMPCDPDEMAYPGCCEKYNYYGDFPDLDENMIDFGDKEETLADIIGDISMDRVKSYSIKDKKNGKRIIIDIEDAPLLDKRKHGRMIIMSDPGSDRQIHYYRNPQHNVERKVIIKTDDESEKEVK